MSRSVNRVILIGHLGADPELRATASGVPVCDLRMATSRRYNDKAGELQEDTEWHRIVAWDKLATTCERFLEKGSQVYVEGRLQTRKWTDRDGQDRWTTEIVAQTVIFLSSPQRATRLAAAAGGDPTSGW